MLAVAGPTLAAMNEADVQQAIEDAFPVRVLRVEPATVDGKAACPGTILNRGGDRNGAFAATTPVVDAGTAELLPQFRHRADGYEFPASLGGEPRQTNVPHGGSAWR
jgi:hypothetical protein